MEYRNGMEGRQMTREEAAKCIVDFIEHFDELGFYDYYKDALFAALTALSGWVRTADRVPEGGEMELVQGAYQHREWGFMLHEIIAIGWLKSHPEMYPYWMPLPKPPEGGV
jgi:hypothetical protein